MPDGWEEGNRGWRESKHYLEAVGERHQSQAKTAVLFGAVVGDLTAEYRSNARSVGAVRRLFESD